MILRSVLCAVLLLSGCAKADDKTALMTNESTMDVKPVQGVWIDVRSTGEFAQGSLLGASNVPLEQIGQQIEQLHPDKSAPINLYCRSGRRAEVARLQLQQLGYQTVINHGGFDELKDVYAITKQN